MIVVITCRQDGRQQIIPTRLDPLSDTPTHIHTVNLFVKVQTLKALVQVQPTSSRISLVWLAWGLDIAIARSLQLQQEKSGSKRRGARPWSPFPLRLLRRGIYCSREFDYSMSGVQGPSLSSILPNPG